MMCQVAIDFSNNNCLHIRLVVNHDVLKQMKSKGRWICFNFSRYKIYVTVVIAVHTGNAAHLDSMAYGFVIII